MNDLESLQAKHRRLVQRFGVKSEPARKALIQVQAALNKRLAEKPRYRGQAVTERRMT